VVHVHLKKYHDAGLALRERNRGSPLVAWVDHIRGINREFAWRYLAAIEAAFVGA
jgi:hypothetical protein